jgi:hypothetical protein
MRNFIFALTTASLFFLNGETKADTLIWSYAGPGDNNGSGTMEATYNSTLDRWDIVSITGTANLQTIFLLSNYGGVGNYVFPPAPPNVGVDTNGFAFSVGDGTLSYALYEDAGLFNSDSPYSCGGPRTAC